MNTTEFNQIAKNPTTFLRAVPEDPARNIRFRQQLHSYLVQDKGAQTRYLALSTLDPVIWFNTAYFFPAPRDVAGKRTVPCILWPHQEVAIRKMRRAINEGFDLVVDKSRDEGATFQLCGITLFDWLTQDTFNVLLGSRVEYLVDQGSAIINGMVIGDELSLFYKLLYLLASVPQYLQPDGGKGFKKSHMFLQNLTNGSAFSGQPTSMGFGKGSRAAVIGVDEIAQVEPKIARALVENIADVSRCCIFNSTQGPWGEAHIYDEMVKDDRVEKVVLDWTDNPTKNNGLYRSPKDGEVVVYDTQYYRENYPGLLEEYGVAV